MATSATVQHPHATSSEAKTETNVPIDKDADAAARLVDDFLERRGGLDLAQCAWFGMAVGRCVAPERFPNDRLQKELIMSGGDAGAIVLELACQSVGANVLTVDQALRHKYESRDAVETKAYTYRWTAESLRAHGTSMWQQMVSKEHISIRQPGRDHLIAVWDRNGFVHLSDGDIASFGGRSLRSDGGPDGNRAKKAATAFAALGFETKMVDTWRRRLLPFAFLTTASNVTASPVASTSHSSTPRPSSSLPSSAPTETERQLLLRAIPAWLARAILQWKTLTSKVGGLVPEDVPRACRETVAMLCGDS